VVHPGTYSKLAVSNFVIFHRIAGLLGISTVDHLDESMAFVDVDNACLHNTESIEECP
jgi:hypothetical protein